MLLQSLESAETSFLVLPIGMDSGILEESDLENACKTMDVDKDNAAVLVIVTVRDVGGNAFSLKKAIDQGIVLGPRVFPSGPMISQSSGHSDHRTQATLRRGDRHNRVGHGGHGRGGGERRSQG